MEYYASDPERTHLNRIIRTLTDPDAHNDEVYGALLLRVLELKQAGDPAWLELDRERARIYDARLRGKASKNGGQS